jgi:hypothetical protein
MVFASQTQVWATGVFLGNELVELMREYDKNETGASGVNYLKLGEYGGYVMGVCDATTEPFNAPTSVTKGQICAVVSKYLKNHPERWSEPAAFLVIKVLQEAFPNRATR